MPPNGRCKAGWRRSRATCSTFAAASIQYNILQREVDTNRSLYDALLQRYKEIGVAGGIGVAPVSIVDRADVAASCPFKPAAVAQPAARNGRRASSPGSIGAVGLEVVNDTIKSREDVRKKLDLSCIGIIPEMRAQGELSSRN